MKPLTKLYLKIFLFTGIPYGLIMMGIDLMDGNGFNLWKFLFLAFFFGITMSLILVSFHKYSLKKNGIQELMDENLGVIQTKVIKTKLSKTELINKLKSDPIVGKMKMRESENGIVLKTGISWKSWGEEIVIDLKSKNGSDFEYQVSSSPKQKTTLLDFGKNLKNLNRIESVIKNIA
jgi:maltodextrin utilization protein YvdJ